MNRNVIIGVVVVLVVLVGGMFLMNNQSQTPSGSTPETESTDTSAQPTTGESTGTTESTSPAAGEESGNVVEVTVTSKGLNFTPAEIRVKKGDTVKLTYQNGMGKHDWTIDEFNAKTPLIDAGEEATIEFVADKTGEFEYYCSVPGHRQAGMKGMLIVE